MEIFKSEEQSVILTQKYQDNFKCDIEVSYEKPIILNEESEIGVLEISLPKSVKKDNFSSESKMDVIISFDYEIDNFKDPKQYPLDKHKDGYTLKKGNFLTFKYILEPDISNLKKFTEIKFKEIFEPKIKEILKTRFDLEDYEFDKFEITPPWIDYSSDGHFINKPGGIFLTVTTSLSSLGLNISAKSLIADVIINFDRKLHYLLGFDPANFPVIDLNKHKLRYSNTKILKPIRAEKSVKNFDHFIENFYIYSNIVGETYVGNVKANILRVFQKIDSSEEIVTYNFHNIFFVPLRVREINCIKIQICDSFGDIAVYDEGEITIVLIIRPIKS